MLDGFSPCFVGYLSAVPAKADKIKNLLTAPQSSVQTYSCLRRAVRSNQNHAWFAPAQKCILPACPSRDSEHFLHASHALQLRKQECSLIGPSVSQRFVISLHSLLEAKAFSLPPAESVIALITKQASALLGAGLLRKPRMAFSVQSRLKKCRRRPVLRNLPGAAEPPPWRCHPPAG